MKRDWGAWHRFFRKLHDFWGGKKKIGKHIPDEKRGNIGFREGRKGGRFREKHLEKH